jgi:hypothetical protein
VIRDWVRIDRETSDAPFELRVTDTGGLIEITERWIDVRNEDAEEVRFPFKLAEIEWLHEALGELLALRTEERKREAANDDA